MIFRFKKNYFPFRAPKHSVFVRFHKIYRFFAFYRPSLWRKKVHCKPNADWSIGHHTSQSESRRQSAYVSVTGRVRDARQGKLSSFLLDFNIKKAKKRGKKTKKDFPCGYYNSASILAIRDFRPFSVIAENHWPYHLPHRWPIWPLWGFCNLGLLRHRGVTIYRNIEESWSIHYLLICVSNCDPLYRNIQISWYSNLIQRCAS